MQVFMFDGENSDFCFTNDTEKNCVNCSSTLIPVFIYTDEVRLAVILIQEEQEIVVQLSSAHKSLTTSIEKSEVVHQNLNQKY